MELTVDNVRNIHNWGGTMLGSDRGGFDIGKIVDFLTSHGVNQVYVIGGDGTHRAANIIANEVQKRRLPIVVAGVPKTIDNDVDIIDRSFGFQTAVEEGLKAIKSARVEADSAVNGIGIVKLMGRYAAVWNVLNALRFEMMGIWAKG